MPPVATPLDPSELAREVERLRLRDGPLASQAGLEVFLGTAEQLPQVLLEIGRLRELSFRAVGEGSGRERDLDRFDHDYLHLFLWDPAARAVGGEPAVPALDRFR